MRLPLDLDKLPGWAWAAVGFGAVWLLMRPKDTAAAVARTVTGVVSGAAEGTVKGVAAAVGIPDTDSAKCDAALAADNGRDASLYCPAGRLAAAIPSSFATWVKGFARPPSTSAKPATGSATNTGPLVMPWEIECVAGICGPTFEGQSTPGIFDLQTWVDERNGTRPTITPVSGLRG